MQSTGFVVGVPQPWHALLLIVMAITHQLDRKNIRRQKSHPLPELPGCTAFATSVHNLGK
jgi:hypothetical protein